MKTIIKYAIGTMVGMWALNYITNKLGKQEGLSHGYADTYQKL